MLPILLLCIAGIVDLGRLIFVHAMATNAAREGARMKSMGYSNAQASIRVNAASPSLSQAPLSITVAYTDCPAGGLPTDGATATVTDNGFEWIMLDGIMGLVGGGPAAPTPTSSANMRCLDEPQPLRTRVQPPPSSPSSWGLGVVFGVMAPAIDAGGSSSGGSCRTGRTRPPCPLPALRRGRVRCGRRGRSRGARRRERARR